MFLLKLIHTYVLHIISFLHYKNHQILFFSGFYPFLYLLFNINHAPDEAKAREALDRVNQKWTTTIRNWAQVYGELSIMYEGRLPE